MLNAVANEPDYDDYDLLVRRLISTVNNGNFDGVRRFLQMLGDAIGQL